MIQLHTLDILGYLKHLHGLNRGAVFRFDFYFSISKGLIF